MQSFCSRIEKARVALTSKIEIDAAKQLEKARFQRAGLTKGN